VCRAGQGEVRTQGADERDDGTQPPPARCQCACGCAPGAGAEFSRAAPYWVPEATRQVPRIRRLIAACRTAGVPVIFTVFSATHRYLDRPATGPLMPNRYPDLESDPSWFSGRPDLGGVGARSRGRGDSQALVRGVLRYAARDHTEEPGARCDHHLRY